MVAVAVADALTAASSAARALHPAVSTRVQIARSRSHTLTRAFLTSSIALPSEQPAASQERLDQSEPGDDGREAAATMRTGL